LKRALYQGKPNLNPNPQSNRNPVLRRQSKQKSLDQPKLKDSNTGQLIQFFFRLFSRQQGSVIDGTLAGDLGESLSLTLHAHIHTHTCTHSPNQMPPGFDPLGISDTKPKLKRMREIELKHARIAMLATIGWPISGIYFLYIFMHFIYLTSSISLIRAIQLPNGAIVFPHEMRHG
jgi:hypothetical protein